MTNYNERLDEVLVSFYNHAAQDVADNHLQDGKLITTAHTKAKQALTSLIKELVAEARIDEVEYSVVQLESSEEYAVRRIAELKAQQEEA